MPFDLQPFRDACRRLDVPSKEVLETLAFFDVARSHIASALGADVSCHLVDVGGGRGLTSFCWLAWAGAASATIVDQSMPRSHVATARAMRRAIGCRTPDFFVGKLAEFPCVSDGPTAFVGLHCCGGLADEVIDAAIAASAPFAVMSCCHPFRDPLLKTASAWLADGQDPGSLIDLMRLDRARQQGYDVRLETIDPSITPKNRVLLGKPHAFASQPRWPKKTHRATAAWSDMRSLRSRLHHLGQILRSVAGGDLVRFGRTFGSGHVNLRVDDHRGRAYLIRLCRDTWDRAGAVEGLLREERFYGLAADLGAPAPEVFAVDGRGKLIRDVYMVRSYLPGLSLSDPAARMGPEDRAQVCREVGAMLRQLHSHQLEGRGMIAGDGVPEGRSPCSHLGWLDAAVEQGVSWLRDNGRVSGSAADEIHRAVADRRPALDAACERNALVHGDCHAGNVLVAADDAGWHVTGLIDADHAAAGDPAWDLAQWECEATARGNWPRDALMAGYGVAPEPAAHLARVLALVLRAPERYAPCLADGLAGLRRRLGC